MKGVEIMKKITNYLMRRKGVLSMAMIIGSVVTVLSKYGCCFYIYHQPHFPDALKDIE